MAQAPKFRETLTLLYQRFNALQRGEKRCFGLTDSQCFLVELLQRLGCCSVRDLAQGLGLDQSTVTRGVAVLERDGLVRRARDEEKDRRRVFISLSKRGREMAAKLEICTENFCEDILQRVSPESREEMSRALRVLVDALDESPRTPA